LIKSETRERVARIRFDRLDKKNAITAQMYAQLGSALAAADADPQVRAVLLSGSAECFTAGNDVADFLNRGIPAEAGTRQPGSSPARALFDTLPNMKKPVVAAVGGPAIGIGTTLLLHCDLVYAAPNARFQLPFVPLGIVPEFGSTFLLPRLAGYQRAAELLLLGQPFSAQKAHEVGIVSEVVSQEELFNRAEAAVLHLASLPPESVRLTKQLLKARYAEALASTIDEETRLFTERLSSPEAKEAMSAFLEKRKPDFSRF
jgi:enoyl-CoA hydratase/carnithine racemase